MFDWMIPLLFWLSLPLSVISSVAGILKDKYWLSILGAFLFLPLAYYMNGSPTLHGFPILLPVFQLASAAAVSEGYKRWAWLFLAMPFLLMCWMVVVFIFYFSG